MVMGGDSCSKGRGFESWLRILDGHFFTYDSLERPKINDKRCRGWPIKNVLQYLPTCPHPV